MTRPAGKDGGGWVPVGVAAESAGVTYRELRSWVDAGELECRTVRADGTPVDLVRATDLARLAPEVDPAQLERAARRTWRTTAPVVLERARATEGEAAALADWGDTALEEIERLRAELGNVRARARAEAEANEATLLELRGLLRRSGERDESPVLAAESTATVQEPSPLRSAQPWIAAAVALVAGFGAARWTGVPRPLPRALEARPPAPDPERVVVERTVDPASAEEERWPWLTGMEMTPPTLDAPLDPGGLVAESNAEPSPGTPVEPESSAGQESTALAAAALAEPAEAETIRRRAEFEGRLSRREAVSLAMLAREPGVPACAHFATVRPGAELRRVLGACYGPPTADGMSVAGTHRIAGVPCCAQHQLVERMGGDVAPLLLAAEVARSEGLLPPLVRARIERAALEFLKVRCGRARSFGLEDYDSARGEGPANRVRWVDEESQRAVVETWVELEEGERSRVELELAVGDGSDGDALLRLEFTD